MKKLLLSIVLLLSVFNLQAQTISHIETTKNWYYIYDQDVSSLTGFHKISANRSGI